jgi:hypothetical protein
MSDSEADPKPACAPTEPSPSPAPEPAPTINIASLKTGGFSTDLEAPMMAWVKGGTSTAAYDLEIKKNEAEAEARRDAQDKDRAIASKPIEEGGGKMFSHNFGHPTDDPKILIRFVNSKKETEFELLCDIGIEQDGSSRWFIFICPDCVSRGIPSGQAQLRVCDNHRHWSLDDRTQGEVIVFDEQIYYSAGRIMDTETLRCPNAHCTLAVKIHNNMMYRV